MGTVPVISIQMYVMAREEGDIGLTNAKFELPFFLSSRDIDALIQ